MWHVSPTPCMNTCMNYSWWRHQMETFSPLLAICAGNSPVPGEFPAQRPVTQSFDLFFDLPPNKREASDLRRHRAHYDVIVMLATHRQVCLFTLGMHARLCLTSLHHASRQIIQSKWWTIDLSNDLAPFDVVTCSIANMTGKFVFVGPPR